MNIISNSLDLTLQSQFLLQDGFFDRFLLVFEVSLGFKQVGGIFLALEERERTPVCELQRSIGPPFFSPLSVSG